MTNTFPGLARGPIDHEASSVINAVANEAISMGDLLQLVAEPSTEILPRVEIADGGQGLISYGIAIGGDADGIYGSGAAAVDDTTRATTAAGEAVVVLTQGRCLARVLTGVAFGAELTQSATAGALETAIAGDIVVAVALKATTGSDIIPIDFQREGIF